MDIGLPIALSVAFLFLVAMLRGQATYWLARTLTQQALRRTAPSVGWRASLHRWLSGDALVRGRRAVERFGVLAVPLCYVTVGLQTVVLATAGCLRFRWVHFTAAQVPGALAWATIYTTIGFAVWDAAIAAAAGNTTVLIACAAVLVAVAALLTERARRSRIDSSAG